LSCVRQSSRGRRLSLKKVNIFFLLDPGRS
jgi:hypothetical protein